VVIAKLDVQAAGDLTGHALVPVFGIDKIASSWPDVIAPQFCATFRLEPPTATVQPLKTVRRYLRSGQSLGTLASWSSVLDAFGTSCDRCATNQPTANQA
jgi:hypothetical protein